MTIVLSFGRWGGIYTDFGYTWRICLGWVALTLMPFDIDDVLGALCPRARDCARFTVSGDSAHKGQS